MTKRQLKLGLVTTGVGGPGQTNRWLDPEIPVDASVDIDWYIDIVRQAEAAKFDLVFIVDSQFITADSPPHYLNRLEPLTLLSALAVATSHIGLVGTLTTSYNEPFNLARRLASLDLISKGRAGWNVVTSGDTGTAGNYSRDEHYDYATRYGRAFEYLDVVRGLWRSYEDGALVHDRATGVFLDKTRLHALNHKGEHFSVVGPLNIQRSLQGEPVIFQAGDSEQGRTLGATVADAIFTHARTIEQGQAFYADIQRRAVALGRGPDAILILPGFTITIGDTDADAHAIERAHRRIDQSFDQALAEFGRAFGWHDFRQVRYRRALSGSRARTRKEQLLHPGQAHHQSGGRARLVAAADGRASTRPVYQPVRGIRRDRGRRDRALVRGAGVRRDQRPRRPSEPVPALYPGGRPVAAGARTVPQRL
jgi:FMN-dependent oxidoreductase (nitrilotriacetate monooxygenase family)